MATPSVANIGNNFHPAYQPVQQEWTAYQQGIEFKTWKKCSILGDRILPYESQQNPSIYQATFPEETPLLPYLRNIEILVFSKPGLLANLSSYLIFFLPKFLTRGSIIKETNAHKKVLFELLRNIQSLFKTMDSSNFLSHHEKLFNLLNHHLFDDNQGESLIGLEKKAYEEAASLSLELRRLEEKAKPAQEEKEGAQEEKIKKLQIELKDKIYHIYFFARLVQDPGIWEEGMTLRTALEITDHLHDTPTHPDHLHSNPNHAEYSVILKEAYENLRSFIEKNNKNVIEDLLLGQEQGKALFKLCDLLGRAGEAIVLNLHRNYPLLEQHALIWAYRELDQNPQMKALIQEQAEEVTLELLPQTFIYMLLEKKEFTPLKNFISEQELISCKMLAKELRACAKETKVVIKKQVASLNGDKIPLESVAGLIYSKIQELAKSLTSSNSQKWANSLQSVYPSIYKRIH